MDNTNYKEGAKACVIQALAYFYEEESSKGVQKDNIYQEIDKLVRSTYGITDTSLHKKEHHEKLEQIIHLLNQLQKNEQYEVKYITKRLSSLLLEILSD